MKLQKGFTVIEVLIVIIIVGILFAVALPHIVVMRHRARYSQTIMNMQTVQLAAESYRNDHNGEYPATSDELVRYLPGGLKLKNQFTQERTEPSNLYMPGAVAYEPRFDDNRYIIGYVITASDIDRQGLPYTYRSNDPMSSF